MRLSASDQGTAVADAGLTLDQADAAHRRDIYMLAQLYRAEKRPEAEQLMRQVLELDEKSYGREHPNVARDLYDLAQVLEDAKRPNDAQPLMRQHVVIFIKLSRRMGHQHPDLEAAKTNYADLLRRMGKSQAEIEAELAELSKDVK
jgi:hypothetical protein